MSARRFDPRGLSSSPRAHRFRGRRAQSPWGGPAPAAPAGWPAGFEERGPAGSAGLTNAAHAEGIMVTDARAAKLAAIEQRIREGVYNTRQSIERVVDRLLDEWKRDLGRGASRSGD